jgi:hypothetical protein
MAGSRGANYNVTLLGERLTVIIITIRIQVAQ